MVNKLFRVRPGLWKLIRREVYDRDKGVCQKCGQPVKESPDDPDFFTGTDKPTWTVHHENSQRALAILARKLCEHLSGQPYIAEVRNVYTRLATDKLNLELRCNRVKCRQH